MAEPAFRLKGVLTAADGTIEEVEAAVMPPELHPEGRCWVCKIRCPVLLDGDRRVTAVDASSVLDLAEILIRQIFAFARVGDIARYPLARADGQPAASLAVSRRASAPTTRRR